MNTISRTVAEEMLVALDRAAWMVGTAQGRIPSIGYVEIDRIGRNRIYQLDGRRVAGAAIYRATRKQD